MRRPYVMILCSSENTGRKPTPVSGVLKSSLTASACPSESVAHQKASARIGCILLTMQRLAIYDIVHSVKMATLARSRSPLELSLSAATHCEPVTTSYPEQSNTYINRHHDPAKC